MFAYFQGVILPSDGMAGYVGGDDMEAAIGYVECMDRDAEVVKTNESKGNNENKIQSRLLFSRILCTGCRVMS